MVRGKSAENVEKKKETGRKNTLKNEQKEKGRTEGEPNNNNKHLCFTFYKELYFAQKHSLNKASLNHRILFIVFI